MKRIPLKKGENVKSKYNYIIDYIFVKIEENLL